jgi:hypothetical protein
MGMEYMKENYAYLKEKAKGLQITDTALYASHFLGAYGARKFLSSPGEANANDVVGSSAISANASVFREPTGRKGVYGRVRTVQEALAEIDKRMKDAQSQHDLRPGQKPTVEEGAENPANENSAQTNQGEPDGAAAQTGMDGASPDGGATTSGGGDPGGAQYTGIPGVPSYGGGANGAGGEAPATNASNGMATGAGGGTYSTPSSPDPAAAQASGNATLIREPDDDQGTFGKLRLPDGTEFFTLELPWRDNATGASCIPPGTYQVAMRNSPKFGQIYEVMNVPGRSAILIHSGNVAGDKSQGYNSHVEGCILLGLNKGTVAGQKAVQQSRAAIAQFNEKMGGRPFTLSITGAGKNAGAKSAGEVQQDDPTTLQGGSDPASAANGAASGAASATNTQPTSGGYGAQPSGGPDTSSPTITQSTTNQNQNTTALATADLASTVGPLLQQQLEVQKSMDGSLKDIRKFLEQMSQQSNNGMQGQQPQQNQQGGGKAQQEPDDVVATQPPGSARQPSTSTGSGRNPLNTRRNQAVT